MNGRTPGPPGNFIRSWLMVTCSSLRLLKIEEYRISQKLTVFDSTLQYICYIMKRLTKEMGEDEQSPKFSLNLRKYRKYFLNFSIKRKFSRFGDKTYTNFLMIFFLHRDKIRGPAGGLIKGVPSKHLTFDPMNQKHPDESAVKWSSMYCDVSNLA